MSLRALFIAAFVLISAQSASAVDLCQALFSVSKSSTARVLSGPLPPVLKQVFFDLDEHQAIRDWQLKSEVGNLSPIIGRLTPIQHEAMRTEINFRYNSSAKNEHAETLLQMPRRMLDLMIAYDLNPTEFISSRVHRARFWQSKKQIAKSAFVDYLSEVHRRYPNVKGGTIDASALFETIEALKTYLREQKSNGGKIRTLTIFGSASNGLASKSSDLDLMVTDGGDPWRDHARFKQFASDIGYRLKELMGARALEVENAFPVESSGTFSSLSPIMIDVTATGASLVLYPVGFNSRFSRSGLLRTTPLAKPLIFPIE